MQEEERKVTIIAVKKYNVKGGKRYGPYPKAPDEYYLYEQRWDPEKKRPVMKYLGRGKKPPEAVVKEVEGVVSFLKQGERPSQGA